MPRALDLVTEVKAAHQASLGDDHPNTLVAANNLACYLRCIGRLPEALALADDTLSRMRRKLGESHPLTLSCAVNLANCRGDSGDPEGGRSAGARDHHAAAGGAGPGPSGHPGLRGQSRRHPAPGWAGQARPRNCGPGSLATSAASWARATRTAAQLQKWQRINRDLEPQQI